MTTTRGTQSLYTICNTTQYWVPMKVKSVTRIQRSFGSGNGGTGARLAPQGGKAAPYVTAWRTTVGALGPAKPPSLALQTLKLRDPPSQSTSPPANQ